jgi:hypothetical protein
MEKNHSDMFVMLQMNNPLISCQCSLAIQMNLWTLDETLASVPPLGGHLYSA